MEDKVDDEETFEEDESAEGTNLSDIGLGLVLLGFVLFIVFIFLLGSTFFAHVEPNYRLWTVWQNSYVTGTLGGSIGLMVLGGVLHLVGKRDKEEEEVVSSG